MSDSEDETFESADAGATNTAPAQASSLRKNGFVMLKSQPCKIVDMSTSKTGKHGHAKIHFIGINIFTGKKVEDLCPSTHNMFVPSVTRTDYTLIDISSDGFLHLLDSDGEIREDLTYPPDDELTAQIKEIFEAGDEATVTVMGAIGTEQIIAVRKNMTS